MWVQVRQKDRRLDLRAEADTGEMQRTEHGSIWSFRGPDLDTVSRDGTWKILAHLGCLFTFLTILRQLHEGQKGQVKHNGSLSGSFPISNARPAGLRSGPHIVLHLLKYHAP